MRLLYVVNQWALKVHAHWEVGARGELEHGAFLRRYVNTLVAIVFNLRQVVGGLMGDAGTIVAPPVHERFVGRNAHDYALLLRMQATCQEWDALLLESQGHCGGGLLAVPRLVPREISSSPGGFH